MASWLTKLGDDFKTAGKDIVLVTEKAAPLVKVAGTVVGAFYPGLGTLITGTAQLIVNTEGQFAAADAASGTGTQKAAVVLSVMGNALNEELEALGLNKDGTTAQDIVDELVAFMNIDPNLFAQLAALENPLAPSTAPAAGTASTTTLLPTQAEKAQVAAAPATATKSPYPPGPSFTVPSRKT